MMIFPVKLDKNPYRERYVAELSITMAKSVSAIHEQLQFSNILRLLHQANVDTTKILKTFRFFLILVLFQKFRL
jgi:hypothetical protein